MTTTKKIGSSINKVFGIGWHKTGTTSLGAALMSFGCYHQKGDYFLTNRLIPKFLQGDYSEILDITRQHDSFEDLPYSATGFYKVLDEEFPGSKFILTRRDPDKWIRSLKKQCSFPKSATDNLLAFSRALDKNKSHPLGLYHGLVAYHRHAFGDRPIDGNENHYIEIYEKHNSEVIDYFAGRDDLLIMDFEKGDGWQQLCPFLGVPTVNSPFPHSNPSTKRNNPRKVPGVANEPH